jgi:hypothetical protein
MSFAYGPPIVTGALNFGTGGFGVLGSSVAADGIDGPGYPYNSLSLPADAGKEYLAWITTPPTQGVLTINALDFSYTWTGLPQGTHSFGFTLVEDGVALSPERFVYVDVDVVRQVSGAVLMDNTLASGAMFVATVAIYGTTALDDIQASGEMECINPSTLEGAVSLAPVAASGTLGIELDETPMSPGELRHLYNMIRDLHMIHGLTVGAPLTVGQTARVAGSIEQTITDVGGATVITRG